MKTAIPILLLLFGSAEGAAQTVIRPPEQSPAAINDRWQWAANESKRLKLGGVWIGYSIERLMAENSWIGSFHSIPDKETKSLFEVLTGQRIEFPFSRDGSGGEVVRRGSGKTALKEKSVVKEVALLFEFRGDPSDLATLRTIRVTNVALAIDLDGLPVIWLGKVGKDESLGHLERMLDETDSRRVSQKIVQSAGLHGNSPGAFRFLSAVLQGSGESSIREEAAFWIGQLDTLAGLKLLVEIARNDKSGKVAEKAVFAISQMSPDEAIEALIELGRNAPTRQTRKKAVFWLGHRASRKVIEVLEEFAYEEKDEEIQKQAVFALTQLPENEGVSHLIRIAKTHPNPRVRKQAVFWLGESEDPRAFDAIIEIARGK